MLAGPPRLVSLVTILLFLGIAWWYIGLIQQNPASTISSKVPSAAKGRPYVGNPLDFGIPIRFSDGVVKPPGSNYSHVMVVPKTMKEDLNWMARDLPDTPLIIYEVDNPNAKNKVPKNKGREAMVYLTYIIDHYNELPEIILFMHAHRYAWHNNILMGQDGAQMIRRLNHERVARLGYMNVRCHHEPGCPDWIHMDRPGGDFDFFHKPEEIYWRRDIWEEIHPGAPIPPTISGVCCAQFAVSRDRIRQVPIERFQHYRNWLLTTKMDDQFSGRIFEYIWHYIFTGHEVLCPAMNSCYCDGYGICFGGRQKLEDYFKAQDARNALYGELDGYVKEEDKAREEGRTIEWNETQKAWIGELKNELLERDPVLEKLRNEALARGQDPKARAEETESWDSSHIWDYGPDKQKQG
ncbi:hypothetical protein B0J11DRAFT_508955 [Dendryphion nanum]|uniref:Uncharacterized protein n=1 Tax=Dendryphion nanum TaxID=256645 RepID=A0A9P9DGJ8_9PLEO|nr:hypothetical protein B0J11DRAFT_508955 [Dendryphion nanum]